MSEPKKWNPNFKSKSMRWKKWKVRAQFELLTPESSRERSRSFRVTGHKRTFDCNLPRGVSYWKTWLNRVFFQYKVRLAGIRHQYSVVFQSIEGEPELDLHLAEFTCCWWSDSSLVRTQFSERRIAEESWAEESEILRWTWKTVASNYSAK